MRLPNGYGSITKMKGNRRKPYIVRVTKNCHYDKKQKRYIQKMITLGYAATREEGLIILLEYNQKSIDLDTINYTFRQVYEAMCKIRVANMSKSSRTGYSTAYKASEVLHDKTFRNIRTSDLQRVIDNTDKNYPTIKKIKVLFNQMYEYANQYDIVKTNHAKDVDISRHINKRDIRKDIIPFNDDQIAMLWKKKNNKYYQIILMMIYTGVRISEIRNLKKEDVHLEEQYFDIIVSKTSNGIRKVPIADKVLPFFKQWYFDGNATYLLHTDDDKQILDRNFRDTYFKPALSNIGITGMNTHSCRHTFITLMARANVNRTRIKMIVGHAAKMSLTERVYTHLDIQTLLDAVNRI